jgi:hypothetical protein
VDEALDNDAAVARRVALSEMRVKAFNTILVGVITLGLFLLFAVLAVRGKISIEAVVGIVGMAMGHWFQKRQGEGERPNGPPPR